LIYALFLQSRIIAGWRGRRGVLLSILGFVVVLFTFLGVSHH
ncbi:MAG TPA: c-type cytochrome biogenesis protein CcsB, partial [Deltaproteobacteria bacterium]|nr:c-type cytochrome biogenesis protein CcsB [Deltaproteobacteria bacterium]